MRIAQLASLTESVPPKGYGGTELVIGLLTDELVKLGHEVTLFASGDSVTKANLVSVVSESLRTSSHIPQTRWAAYDIRSILNLSEIESDFDIVHNHMGWQALAFLSRLRTTTVTTNHNPVKDYCRDIFLSFKHLPYVAISNAYRRLNYPRQLNYVATVYNGIDLTTYDYNREAKRGYLLFLGRICHEKGTAESIQIAHRVGLPIVIAGKVDGRDQNYFDARIRPELSDSSVDFIGEVTEGEKQKLYSNAIAVIYPLNFDEPFGLVMAEALACGTPVAALDRGSVREVLSDGETAIIADTIDTLVERFPEIEKISAEACRERVFELFSKERMARAYVDIYKQLIRRGD